MTVNSKLTIQGTEYTDQLKMTVTSSIGENNASSSFSIEFPNDDGQHKSNFIIGNEVIIYADLDTSPPTTKIITGIVEDINFRGKGQFERMILSGRDFTARLMDSTVAPVVYNNSEVSVIVKDIIANSVVDITTNNVEVTETTLTHIAFNHVSVYDALKQLADLSGFTFWVDVNKDLNFKEKGETSSGVTLDNTNVVSSTFRNSDKELANQVWVYGDRILTGVQNLFVGDGAGSVFGLDYRPHNTEVIVNGSVTRKGGIFELTFGAPTSGIEYLVDFDQRRIIFTSGTLPGDNIPPGSITVNYDRSTPVIKFGEDRPSVDKYGPKVKIISDKNIKDPRLATDTVLSELDLNSEPVIQGNLNLHGVLALTAGNTIVVNLVNQDLSNVTY